MSDQQWARAIDAIILAVRLSPIPREAQGSWVQQCIYGWMQTEHGYRAPSIAAAGVSVADWRALATLAGIDLRGLDEAVARQ